MSSENGACGQRSASSDSERSPAGMIPRDRNAATTAPIAPWRSSDETSQLPVTIARRKSPNSMSTGGQ